MDLDGIRIASCETGLRLAGSYNVTIDLGGSVISGCGNGVEISAGSSNNTLMNGVVEQNAKNGILVDGCSEMPDENLIQFVQVLRKRTERDCAFRRGRKLGPGLQRPGNNTSHDRLRWDCGIGALQRGQLEHDRRERVLWPLRRRFPGRNAGGCKIQLVGATTDPCMRHPILLGSATQSAKTWTFAPWLGSVPSLGDSDNDGLPDQWEIERFGSITLYDGDDDPDNDGLTNAQEYELGSDPNNPVWIDITTPVSTPYFTDGASVSVEGKDHKCKFQSRSPTMGTPVTPVDFDSASGTWSATVTLDAGRT